MILTVSQYIEALTSPDGRTRSLERLYPVGDERGVPVFAMPGHGLVDFEVMVDGERLTLRCPLRWDGAAAARLRAIAEKDRGLGGRFFTEWRIRKAEIVLFDEAGRAFEVDILERPTPAGEPLVDFLGRVAVRGDRAAASALLRSFEEFVRWMESVGRSGIAMHRLLVTPDREVRMTGFSAVDEIGRIREMLLAACGRELYGRQGENPTVVGEVGHQSEIPGLLTDEILSLPDEPSDLQGKKGSSGYGLDGEENIRLVRDGGGWMYVDRRGKAVIDTVWLAAGPFRGGRAEVETHAGRGLIDPKGRAVLSPVYEEVTWDDYWGVAAVMAEGRWGLVDRDGRLLTANEYDWLGECSEGLVLAQKGDRCGFIDTAGREVIPLIYDDASSFCEGCALVSLGGESFFIDARGKRI